MHWLFAQPFVQFCCKTQLLFMHFSRLFPLHLKLSWVQKVWTLHEGGVDAELHPFWQDDTNVHELLLHCSRLLPLHL